MAPSQSTTSKTFSSKNDHVASLNGKGIFVSASAFQSSALNFARNKGMAAVKYLDEGNFKWELSRSLLAGAMTATERRSAAIRNTMIEQSYEPVLHSTYATTPLGFTNSWGGIVQALLAAPDDENARLEHVIQHRPAVMQRVPYLTEHQIEAKANEVLQDIGYTCGRVNLSKLIDQELKISGLRVTFSRASMSALGGISFNPPLIQIFADDKNEPRARFTLAHELGHFYLEHNRYLERELLQPRDLDPQQSTQMPTADVERLEWQANAFAAYLLMPKAAFLERLARLALIHDIRNRGYGFLYLDSQPVDHRLFHLVSEDLSVYFSVSKAAVRLRLSSLGLLVEATATERSPSIVQIVSRRRWC